MTNTNAAKTFTESLLGVIRLQRHFGTRIIISTQEPTISPKLLDLSSLSIIHRFTSPEWYQTIKKHLYTGDVFDDEDNRRNNRPGGHTDFMQNISSLQTGEALVFAPAAVMSIRRDGSLEGTKVHRIKMRQRVTWDGGRSVVSV